MSDQLSFDEMTQKFFEYHGTEEHQQKAYDFITEAGVHYPDRNMLVYNWRYCAAALLNKPDLALALFQEAYDLGYWWSEAYLRSDDDLDILQELPEFNRLVALCEEKRLAASEGVKPMSLALPLPTLADKDLPLLLALHGNNQNAEGSVAFWESAVKEGWLTVLLQSSQLYFTDAFVWDDLELGGREIKAHYDEVAEKHQIDSEQVVLGGFSKGGEMSIWFALMEIMPIAGFISVNPGGPYIQTVEKWMPLIENCKRLTEMRGYFVVGENDPSRENIKALVELLRGGGMACELVIAPEIGHSFPGDFDKILGQALAYVTEA